MRISEATEADSNEIARLLGEIEAYYGGPDTAPPADEVRAALFGDRPAATVLLARDDDQVLGMASYTFLWPAAGADTSIYLKELFVRASARRRGVAGALMDAVAEAGRTAGCSRLEWTADTDNPPALAFYEARGAKENPGKVAYRQAL
ncbi:GNAT family N-acetyltransferase [Streptomyces sp. SID4985]|uniref:GNAT family N-acetyltransferase n=1 Tax=Streptomyces sp. SID4985 TaxID=2690292 RepID=UPI001369F7DF|nr:GNAT family N-acetyltransferase [Streptomyces sp. SID4985]